MKVMLAALLLISGLALVGCGESEEEIHDQGYRYGYVDGYNNGLYDVCRELEGIKPRTCLGF